MAQYHATRRSSTIVVPAIRSGDSLIIPQCPFCGARHIHGAIGPVVGSADGLRVSHCRDDRRRGYWLREVVGRALWVAA